MTSYTSKTGRIKGHHIQTFCPFISGHSTSRQVSTLTAGTLAAVNDGQNHRLCVSAGTLQTEKADGVLGVQPVAATVTKCLEVRLLKNDIDSGKAAPSTEADLHVVEATVALGNVPDLSVTTALGNRILWILSPAHRTTDPWFQNLHFTLGAMK